MMKKILFLCTLLLTARATLAMQQDPTLLGAILLSGHKDALKHLKSIFHPVACAPRRMKNSRSFEKDLSRKAMSGHRKSNSFPNALYPIVTTLAIEEKISTQEKLPEAASPKEQPERRKEKDFFIVGKKLWAAQEYRATEQNVLDGITSPLSRRKKFASLDEIIE